MTTGLVTTSDLTVGVKIDMDEAIYLISPLDSPLINGLDADGAVILGSLPTEEIKFEWMDEELLVPRSELNGAVTTGETVITLADDDERLRFSTGDILILDSSERIKVTAYGSTTGTLEVTRGFNSTTATEYADATKVQGLGTALAEGSDPEAARVRDRAQDHNFTQIFGPTAIHMSGTEQVVSKYGVSNEFQKQIFNRTKENVISREQAYLYGTRHQSGDVRTTGGFDHFISTVADTTSTQLTVTNIETNMETCYDNGGIPDLLTCNPKVLGPLNALNDTGRVRVDINDPRRGRMRVLVVHTEYGDITIVRNRYCRVADAFGWTRDQVIRRKLRGFTLEPLAKTGDADKVQLLCEEGLQVKGEEHAFKMSALTE